jgi:hypothetical protein
VSGTEPQILRTEEPQDPVLEVPRPGGLQFGFRSVAILTIVVMVSATLLVILLYMSPLAAK